MRALWGIARVLLCTVVFGQCLTNTSAAEDSASKKLASPNLPNLFSVCDGIFSGGQPEGEDAFKELKALGVRTIISVDGAKPNLALAEKFGIRYVHFPLGYDGVSQERGKQLAKAVRVLESPVYFHCHHGRHRSPAAVAVACVHLGRLSRAQAIELLKTAGTDPRYKGLFRSVENAAKLSDQVLEATPAEFPAVSDLPPMAESMVEVDQLFEHLKAARKLDWKFADQPPNFAEKVALLHEKFRELKRLEDPRTQQVAFIDMCKTSEAAILTIERIQSTARIDSLDANQIEILNTAMNQLESQCSACHQKFRD